MPFTPYTLAAQLDSLFGNTSSFGALASAPAIYVGLSSTAPGTSVTEPSAGGYARIATAATDWAAATAASPSVLSNAVALAFPTATADWLLGVNLVAAVLYDALTLGNLLGYSTLTVAKPVLSGDTMSFATGDISVSSS